MFYHEHHKYPASLPIEANLFSNIPVMAHWHADYELILVKKGSVTIGVNAHTRKLYEGEIAVITSGDIHYLSVNPEEEKYYCVLFNPAVIEGIADHTSQTVMNNPFITYADLRKLSLSKDMLKRIQYCFLSIYDELVRREPFYQMIAKAKIAELLGLVYRFTVHSPEPCPSNASVSGNLHLIRKAIRFIENNYEHDIFLEDVSKHLNVSTYYFSRLFSKTTGMTYKMFLNTTRIEKSIQFLQSTGETVTSIAYECGFRSIRTFNRVFKELKDFPPSDIRRASKS